MIYCAQPPIVKSDQKHLWWNKEYQPVLHSVSCMHSACTPHAKSPKTLNGVMSSVAKLNCGFLCVTLVTSPQSKVGGFSTFHASKHASASPVTTTQRELANEIAHTNSKHITLLCSEQQEIWLVVFGTVKKRQKHPSPAHL